MKSLKQEARHWGLCLQFQGHILSESNTDVGKKKNLSPAEFEKEALMFKDTKKIKA